jgi:hypothetical protein
MLFLPIRTSGLVLNGRGQTWLMLYLLEILSLLFLLQMLQLASCIFIQMRFELCWIFLSLFLLWSEFAFLRDLLRLISLRYRGGILAKDIWGLYNALDSILIIRYNSKVSLILVIWIRNGELMSCSIIFSVGHLSALHPLREIGLLQLALMLDLPLVH